MTECITKWVKAAVLLCFFIFTQVGLAQVTIVNWNFPTNPDNATADGGIAANSAQTISTNGGTSALTFATAGSTTRCASATQWNAGSGAKYWLISFTSSGYSGLAVSSKQKSPTAASSPRDFKLQYSLDNAAWTDVSNVPALANNFTAGVLNNVSLPGAADNQTTVYLRWIMTSNTSVNGTANLNGVSTGVSSIDDIVITGCPITPATPTSLGATANSCTQITASWTAATNATSYQLDVASDAGFTSIVYTNSAIVSTSQAVTGLLANTTYYFRVKTNISGCSSSSYASSISASTSNPSTSNCYCTATGPGTYYLTNVTFAGINNTTAYAAYTFNSSPIATINLGCTFSISLTENSFLDYYRVWIDYNQDGSFASAESVFSGQFGSPSPATATGSITIPLTATLGTTRMRVMHSFSTIANTAACTNTSASGGEVEDYLVTIGAVPATPSAPAAATAYGNTCNSFIANWPSITDASSYVLDVSTVSDFSSFVAGYNGLSITSGTSYNVTGLAASTTYYYRVRAVNCSGSASSNSNVITAITNTTCYCTPAGSTASGDYITNVTFNTLNNTTGASSGGYVNYSSLSATNVTQGASYSLSVIVGNGTWTEFVRAYFDWNQDGDFTDSGESFDLGSTTTTVSSSILIPCSNTGYVRMRIVQNYNAYSTSCATGLTGEAEDYYINVIAGTPLAVSSSTSTQSLTSAVYISSTNNQIIGIEIVTTGVCGPYNATSIDLSTVGSTDPSTDITNAKIWYTGSSSTFATTTQFGSTLAAPDGDFTITGSQSLLAGSNYFWLTYDIPSTAVQNNVVDATCSAITVGDSTYTPDIIDPDGSRAIELNYCTPSGHLTCSAGDRITNVTLNTLNNTTGTTCAAGSSGGYVAFAATGAQTTGLYICSNYTLSASFAVSSATSHDAAVWVDFDQNGTFDATEYTLINNNITTASTQTVTLSIPPTAILGQTKMRIRYGSGLVITNAMACSTGGAAATRGETEDYYISILPPVVVSTTQWTGVTNTDWNTPSNWDSGVPSKCSNAIIQNVANSPIIAATTIAECFNLTVNSTATLTIQSTTGSLNTYGTVVNDGTINFTPATPAAAQYMQLYGSGRTVSGTGTYTNLSFRVNNGASYTISSSVQLKNLNIVSSTTSPTVTLSGASTIADVSNSLTQNGYLNLGDGTMQFGGSGSPGLRSNRFNAGTGLFYYNSTSALQNVLAMTYYDLKVNSNATFATPIGATSSSSGTTISCHNFDIVAGSAITSGYCYLSKVITVTGNLSISSGCTLDVFDHRYFLLIFPLNDNTITLGGNWTNDGTFLNGVGASGPGTNRRTVILNGTTDQTMRGTSNTSFYSLTFNKASGSVYLVNGITVENRLQMNSNNLYLGNSTLSLTCAGAYTTGALTTTGGQVISEDDQVRAKISWNINNNNGTYTYPFGYSGTSIPFTYQLTSGNAGYVSVATYHVAADNTPYPPTVIHVNDTVAPTSADNSANTVDRFWQIDKTGGSGTANITFTYLDSEKPSNGEDELRAQRWNGTYTRWDTWYTFPNQTANTATNTVAVNSVNMFSPWTLARKLMPLPVELLQFKAEQEESIVKLMWETTTEINCEKYQVERSTDGIDYKTIGEISGNGNSNIISKYNLDDYSPLIGLSFYRLTQFDFDGKKQSFAPVAVEYKSLINKVLLYPNPSNSELYVSYGSLDNNHKYKIEICNMVGQIYDIDNAIVSHEKDHSIKTNVSQLPPGLYILKMRSQDTNEIVAIERFTKN